MENRMATVPFVSFVVPNLGNKIKIQSTLRSVFAQDYPKNKFEVIVVDGGSTPDVIEVIKSFPVRYYHNPKKFAEGPGMAKDQGCEYAKGDIICILESDVTLLQKDWIQEMVKPFIEDEEIFAAACRLGVLPTDSATNRYLSYVGVDPFVANRSIEGCLALDYLNGKLIKKEGYDVYYLDPERPLCTGSNGFMVRKSVLEKIGGYIQDTEMVQHAVDNGFTKLAIPNKPTVRHHNVDSFNEFIKKRFGWIGYFRKHNYYARDFDWVGPDGLFNFFLHTFKQLSMVANVPVSVKKTVQTKDSAWLLHAPLTALTTVIYVYSTLISKDARKKVF
tara:strand:+ start:105 stop:1100 length:996 start_codon:yes stop_codon:yes gene_type:complete